MESNDQSQFDTAWLPTIKVKPEDPEAVVKEENAEPTTTIKSEPDQGESSKGFDDKIELQEESPPSLQNAEEEITIKEESFESISFNECEDKNPDPRYVEEEEDKSGHQRVFSCTSSPKSYTMHPKLEETVRSHKVDFECSVCLKCYRSKNGFRDHILKHEGTVAFKCSICMKYLSSKQTLQVHLRSHEGAFKCSVCLKFFATRNNLRRHKRAQHVCPHCSKSLPSGQKFCDQLRSHAGVFSCPICHRLCNTEENLTEHVRSHIADYRCSICQKSYSNQGTLKKHKKTHK